MQDPCAGPTVLLQWPSNPAALKQLTLTRFRVLVREPEIVFWVFVFPAFLALGLGVAFSDPAEESFRVAVEEGAAERHMEALREHTELRLQVMTAEAARDALRRGEVALVVAESAEGTGGAGGARSDASPTASGAAGTPLLRYDPSRSESRIAHLLAEAAIVESARGPATVTVGSEEIRQRGHRYVDWLIPGLIGFNLMSTGLWVVGFFVTQARQTKQLKRLVATPMRRSDFLLAQVLARFAFLFVEVPLLVVFAWIIFDVRVEGSLLALAVVVAVGAACFTGLGLLVSSRVRTTEGVSGLINLVIMPMVVLSGVFFSPARFPDAAQPYIQALPLTALNDAMRAVYNDGLPLAAAAPDLAIVAAWGAAAFFLALRLFRWQ
jgi:ABC-2 type transport system permease protein